MKKIVVLILAAVVLWACSTQGKEAEKVEAQPLDTAAVVQSVNDIYTKVFGSYAKARTMLRPLRRGNLDAAFCSADWNEWLKRVAAYDKEHSDGMVGFFEADYWIMGQDWQDLSVSDVHVTSMTDTTATVEMNLHNCGNVIAVRLPMVREDDAWKIDDFIDVSHDFDWKEQMKAYMKDKQNIASE